MGELLHQGRSWSGRERNCVFLNTRDRQFVAAASVTGLDHPSDSRALSVCDWDGDGDLDLWLANRSGPRVRFLVNPTRSQSHWIALQLEGTRSNRDAIGATATITSGQADDASAANGAQVRFVKAGDGYLAQSSRWLHFGLGSDDRSVRCEIQWPDGSRDTIDTLEVNHRYRVVQSSGTDRARVERVAKREAVVSWKHEPVEEPDERGAARIVAHAPLPLPRLSHYDWNGQRQDDLQLVGKRPRLVFLWATWCQPCVAELSQFVADADRWKSAGLDWTTLNLDDWDKPVAERLAVVQESLDNWNLKLPGGLATPEAIERLDAVQRVLISRQEAMPLPMSLLLDREGRLAVIYKGPVDEATLRSDLQRLTSSESSDSFGSSAWRDFATPLPGRWYIQPAPADLLAIPQKLLELRQPAWAWDYLTMHVPPPSTGRSDLAEWYGYFLPQLSDLYRRVGIELARERPDETAMAALQASLECNPDQYDTLAAVASLYEAQQRPRQAIETYRRMMVVRPQDLIAMNNVAWKLATAQDESLRNPAEALELAKKVCESTSYRLVPALDTLAAAQAAAGQFEEALSTADRALELLGTQADSPQAISLKARRELYRKHQAFSE